MRQPPLDELLMKTSNKYALVVKVARRARQIAENEISDDLSVRMGKPVTMALFEIVNDKSDYIENVMSHKEEVNE